jgi:hypothetical protein
LADSKLVFFSFALIFALTLSFKNLLRDHVKTKDSFTVVDLGVHTLDAVDYPDIAALVCKQVLSTPGSAGIVLCGSGIGISIACNKINGIRCALCHDYYSAEMCVSFCAATFSRPPEPSDAITCPASTTMRTSFPSVAVVQVIFIKF